MRYALRLYRRLISIRIRAQMQYRASFLLEMFTAILTNGSYFVTIALVLQRFHDVGGWTLGEVALLYGTVETAFGLTDLFFGGFDPPFFGNMVRLGSFDQMLLRPIDPTLQVLGSELQLRRIGRITQGVIVLVIGLGLVQVTWTPIKLLYLPVVLLSLIAFFGGLFIIGSTITFWTVESIEAINILTYGGTEMLAYPMHIYQNWMVRFFTFIVPAIFLNYYPTLYLLDKPDPLGLPWFAPFLSPVVGVGVLALAGLFWNYGIRYYQSTGT